MARAKQRYEPRHAAAPAPPPAPGELAAVTVRLVLSGAVMTAATAVFSLFVWTLLPMLVGWSPSVVLTGSMLPAIAPGDIVVTARAGDDPAAVGHVLRFVDPSRPERHLMHRVIKVNEDGSYVTRGDNNQSQDSTPVPPANVTGIARLRVPLIGLPVVWLHERQVLPLGLTVVGLIATAQLFVGLRRGDDDEGDDEGDDGPEEGDGDGDGRHRAPADPAPAGDQPGTPADDAAREVAAATA